MHEWTWRDWNDPDGGVIRLWGTVATVILPRALRPRDDWDGVAFLLTYEEVEVWDEEDVMEKRSRGALTKLAIEGGGDFARMLERMLQLDLLKAGRFPDPEPRRLFNLAEKGELPFYFVEPDTTDDEWVEYLEATADEAARLSRMPGHLFARRSWRKALKEALKGSSPPKGVAAEEADQLAYAAALSTAWWRRSETMFNPDLRRRRDLRLAARLRGSLASLRDTGVSSPVLMVPLAQAWTSDLLAILKEEPDPEPFAASGAEDD
ncbi:MAG: hypothetical protein MK233_05475 [Candidatus Poseidoniales archaeon]|nr:hypothetical protein [Candidatus Poseidoniales archaeon]